MTYKPDQKASHETVDTSQLIFKSLNPSDSKIREGLKTIRGSSGKTYGEFEMPEAASLVFPALDEAAAGLEQDPKKQNAFKKSQKFMADYFDRRAQATYVSCSLCFCVSLQIDRFKY